MTDEQGKDLLEGKVIFGEIPDGRMGKDNKNYSTAPVVPQNSSEPLGYWMLNLDQHAIKIPGGGAGGEGGVGGEGGGAFHVFHGHGWHGMPNFPNPFHDYFPPTPGVDFPPRGVELAARPTSLAGGTVDFFSKTQGSAIVDSGTSCLSLPADAFRAFWTAAGGPETALQDGKDPDFKLIQQVGRVGLLLCCCYLCVRGFRK